MDFAPVLDVDTCPTNPIIGDRSFHSDPAVVARLGAAFAGGLQRAGVMACGKHFPGHGDTTLDSHLDLPVVDLPRSRLESVELAPYRGLRASTCAAVMTAHVVYPGLDGARPATLSRTIVTGLLRDAGAGLKNLQQQPLSMEDVFIYRITTLEAQPGDVPS